MISECGVGMRILDKYILKAFRAISVWDFAFTSILLEQVRYFVLPNILQNMGLVYGL